MTVQLMSAFMMDFAVFDAFLYWGMTMHWTLAKTILPCTGVVA